jgi:ABC-type amino acid transport substrate-binding protein
VKKPFSEVEPAIVRLKITNSDVQFAITDTAFALSRSLEEKSGFLGSIPFLEQDYPLAATPDERRDEYAASVNERDGKLLEVINSTIKNLKSNGELMKIYEKSAAERFPGATATELSALYQSECSSSVSSGN